MKTTERIAEKLFPEGRLKEILRKQYLRYYNPLYPLNTIVCKAEQMKDGTVLLELTNGVKLFGTHDRIARRTIKYGDASKLNKISHLEKFCDFLEVVCEEYVNDIYHKVHPLRKGDVVVDLGAHVGAYSAKAALAVGPEGRVIAVEPNGENSKLLRANIRINSLQNVEILQKGIWKTKGKSRLKLSVTSGSHSFCADSWDLGNTGESEEVEVDTIDNILQELKIERVDFIKMDIEGAEIEALEGMNETLSLCRGNDLKLAIAAYHPRKGVETYKIVSRQLKEMGFQGHVRDGIICARKMMVE